MDAIAEKPSSSCLGLRIASYAQKLVTGPSGGVFDKLDAVLEQHSLDDFRELV